MKRNTCLVSVVAVALSVAPAFGASPVRSYKGKTSDRHAVSLRATKTQVKRFSFQTRFRCSDKSTFVAKATYRGVKISKAHFKANFANPGGSIKTTITGTVRAKKASGTIVRRATFNSARKLDPKGGGLVCTSRTPWTARRR